MVTQRNPCTNQNHCRRDAPVRFCPQCGEVVNDAVSIQTCSAARHDDYRRRQNLFCIDCGAVLRVAVR